MRHFSHVTPDVRQRLFHREPCVFTSDSPARVLSAALGATLYSPATRPRLADDIVKQSGRGVVSMVLCLEDSIDDAEVADGEENLVRQLTDLAGRPGVEPPLLFIRVRGPEQIPDLVRRLGDSARGLSGFVLPKFTEERGAAFLEALADAEADSGRRLFAMPSSNRPTCCTANPAWRPWRESSASWTSTATGSSPCASASPTSAPPTGCAAPPT